jgi:hypothetical protein
MKKQNLPMSVARASEISLGRPDGCLGDTSKMPGPSWGTSAFTCRRGNKLAKQLRTVCNQCYARKNYYRYYRSVTDAHAKRLAGLNHPLWVEAMVVLITHYVKPEIPFFRWFDSGDLRGIGMLRKIAEVCRRTPGVRHFLPTHEPYIVRDYLKLGGTLPPNLCIRISADFIGRPPKRIKGLENFPTSTVHRGHNAKHRVMVSAKRSDSIECKAYLRPEKNCGACRACWERKVRNVSFALHGEQERAYSEILAFGTDIGEEDHERARDSYVGRRTCTRARRREIKKHQLRLIE